MTEQDWGKFEKITATWNRSVEKGRTLAWTRIGFGSVKGPMKQGSSGPHQGEVPKVRVRSGLLGAFSELSHRTLGPAPHPEQTSWDW